MAPAKPVKNDAYLAELVNELGSDPAYHTGARAFPRPVDEEDASVIAGNLQAEVDRHVEERERAAAQRGVHIPCKLGCSACCAHLVMVYEPEAIRVGRWLSLPGNEEALRGFIERYPGWRDESGDAPEQMAELTALGDGEARIEVHLAHFSKTIMCAFNGTEGECTIYPARPVVCRIAHAVDSPDNCRPSPRDGKPHARSFPFVPLDEFVARARLLGRATHHAIGGVTKRPKALCQAVYEILEKKGKVKQARTKQRVT